MGGSLYPPSCREGQLHPTPTRVSREGVCAVPVSQRLVTEHRGSCMSY